MKTVSEKTQQMTASLEVAIAILTKELDLGLTYLSQLQSGTIVYADAVSEEKELKIIISDLEIKAKKFVEKLALIKNASPNDETPTEKTANNSSSDQQETVGNKNTPKHHYEEEETLDMLERMQLKIIAQEQLSGIYRDLAKPNTHGTSESVDKKAVSKSLKAAEELEKKINEIKMSEKLSDLKGKMGLDLK